MAACGLLHQRPARCIVKRVTLVLQVESENRAETNLLAEFLQRQLQYAVEKVQITREKDNPNSLDTGTILIVVFGTHFAVELARTLYAWLMRNPSARVIIGSGGAVSAAGVSPGDVLKVVERALTKGPHKA
jgi:hypothetical protein